MNYERLALKKLLTDKDIRLLAQLKEQFFLRKPTQLVFKVLKNFYNEYGRIPDVDSLLPFAKLKLADNDYSIVEGLIEGLSTVKIDATSVEIVKGLKEATLLKHIDNNIETLVTAAKYKNVKQVQSIIKELTQVVEYSDKLPVDIKEEQYTPGRIAKVESFLKSMRNNGVYIAGLTLYGAITGGGKSVFAMNQAMFTYEQLHQDVCYINLELPKDEVIERMYCHATGEAFGNVHGNTDPDNVKRVNEWKDKYFDKPNKFKLKCARYTASELYEIIRQQAKEGVSFFVIDYLQIIDADSSTEEWKQLRNLVRDLHSLTIELGIVILTPVQVNVLDVKEKNNNIQVQARGSKELENSATLFLFQWQTYEEYKEGSARIFTIKGRNAPRLTYIVETDYKHMTIKDTGITI